MTREKLYGFTLKVTGSIHLERRGSRSGATDLVQIFIVLRNKSNDLFAKGRHHCFKQKKHVVTNVENGGKS